jgi:hypothetical protein
MLFDLFILNKSGDQTELGQINTTTSMTRTIINKENSYTNLIS